MSNFNLTRVGQIAFNVRDLKKSVEFYRDVLGVPFLFEVPGIAFFDIGGIRLMMSDVEEDVDIKASVLYFRVEDIDASFAHLKSKSVSFIDAPHLIATMPDHELWMVFFRDPEGNMMGLMAEKPLPA